MKRLWVLLAVSACNPNPENGAFCGFSSIAGATMALQYLRNGDAFLTSPPGGMAAALPARVVGYGTSRVLVTDTPDGLVLGYEGTGFPMTPGFGLLLVDDSSEAIRGVMIFDKERQDHMPVIGTISGSLLTIPLHGVRVNWGSVSGERCPLFAPAPASLGT
jgi:hypothetical protein